MEDSHKISEDIRENCSLSNSSQFTNQTMQSAMSILRYFENLHFNDKPITVNTQSTWKIDVPENPLAKTIAKLSKTNPTLISGRPLWSKNMPKIYENPKILQIRLNTLQRLLRLSRITEWVLLEMNFWNNEYVLFEIHQTKDILNGEKNYPLISRMRWKV